MKQINEAVQALESAIGFWAAILDFVLETEKRQKNTRQMYAIALY